MNRTLELQVWRRARTCCEYCQLPQETTDLPFQIDHIIAEQHGGETTLDNLALACLHDNKHKGLNAALRKASLRLPNRAYLPSSVKFYSKKT
jgi:5-methylcytosine-specific restriction endonuclease McrA